MARGRSPLPPPNRLGPLAIRAKRGDGPSRTDPLPSRGRRRTTWRWGGLLRRHHRDLVHRLVLLGGQLRVLRGLELGVRGAAGAGPDEGGETGADPAVDAAGDQDGVLEAALLQDAHAGAPAIVAVAVDEEGLPAEAADLEQAVREAGERDVERVAQVALRPLELLGAAQEFQGPKGHLRNAQH